MTDATTWSQQPVNPVVYDDLQVRQTRALERIATALESLSQTCREEFDTHMAERMAYGSDRSKYR